MKVSSIKFKLIVGGITSVLFPLIIAGVISVYKSSGALLYLGKVGSQNIAYDLARLADNALKEEKKLAEVFAADHKIIDVANQIKVGGENTEVKLTDLYHMLMQQFEAMGDNYEAIFLSDIEGNLFTGVLEGGKALKGISISDRDYFKQMKKSGETIISNVTRSKGSGELVIVICSPIKSKSSKELTTR